MAEKRRDKPLSHRRPQADRAAIAKRRFNSAHNLAGADGSIIARQRITARYDRLFRCLNDSVRRQSAVALKENDLAWPQLLETAPLHGDVIAGANDREHAGPGHFQPHCSATARNFCNEIAAR
jgi:hypothetical protein